MRSRRPHPAPPPTAPAYAPKQQSDLARDRQCYAWELPPRLAYIRAEGTFTIRKLLVVIGIIVVLEVILFFVVHRIREDARVVDRAVAAERALRGRVSTSPAPP